MLAEFLRERAWFQELGTPYDPTPASERDWQQVADYELIIQLLARHREAAANRAKRKEARYGK